MAHVSDAAVRRLQLITEVPDLSHTKYEVLELLGRGGMGSVYLARDRQLDRLVALKVVGTPLAPAGMAERLVREAKILAQLEHPGIVPVHDVGRVPDGRTFYTMKLVRGRRLDAVLSESPTLAELLQIFERICDAVEFAHAHGVIHRDLKPENVMVGSFGEVLVMDWGVAKVRREAELLGEGREALASLGSQARTGAGVVLGTPGYMAPEQAKGDALLADERSDVFALGAILSFLLAAMGTIPRPLTAIAHKATAVEPADRYQRVEGLSSDIARFRSGLAVAAYPEGLAEQVRRVAMRYRVPLALVFAYVLMRMLMLIFART